MAQTDSGENIFMHACSEMIACKMLYIYIYIYIYSASQCNAPFIILVGICGHSDWTLAIQA